MLLLSQCWLQCCNAQQMDGIWQICLALYCSNFLCQAELICSPALMMPEAEVAGSGQLNQ